jgi:COP9 signalosome complex subunit 2
MRMSESNWNEAYNEFFEAFKAYQEAGNAKARDCLKYVVLASMLALNDINIFAAREAKAFSEDKEILAMSELRTSLDNNDLQRFEQTIRNKDNRIMDEPFLMTYIQPLRRRMREQVLLHLTKPYKKVMMTFLASELHLEVEEVEMMIVDMILEKRLDAYIDQINGFVELGQAQAVTGSFEVRKLQALSTWADALSNFSENFYNKLTVN